MGRVQVSLERAKEETRAHAVVYLDTGATLVADTAHEDPRAAIDLLSEKVERQVRREKERLIERNRKGAPGAQPDETDAEPSYDDVIREQLDKD